MALANYTDLQAAALDWMSRAGQTGKTADWVTLAEAKMNRELSPIDADAALVGTVDSASLSLSSLSISKPIGLWITPAGGGDEVELQMQSPGTMASMSVSSVPRQWRMDGTDAILLNRPCDQAYNFRFHYIERFNLSLTTTNWLLTDHPDIYLAAVLMWGAGYNEDWQNGQVWKQTLEEGIQSVRSDIAQSRRGMLRVDPALTHIGRWRRSYDDLRNGVD